MPTNRGNPDLENYYVCPGCISQIRSRDYSSHVNKTCFKQATAEEKKHAREDGKKQLAKLSGFQVNV